MKTISTVFLTKSASETPKMRVDGPATVGERVMFADTGLIVTVTRVLWSGTARDGRAASRVEYAADGAAVRKLAHGPAAAHACPGCGSITELPRLCADCR